MFDPNLHKLLKLKIYIFLELTAIKWQVVMESPIASGADPFVAAAACSSAAEPKTTRIRTKVMKNSIPSPYKQYLNI